MKEEKEKEIEWVQEEKEEEKVGGSVGERLLPRSSPAGPLMNFSQSTTFSALLERTCGWVGGWVGGWMSKNRSRRR